MSSEEPSVESPAASHRQPPSLALPLAALLAGLAIGYATARTSPIPAGGPPAEALRVALTDPDSLSRTRRVTGLLRRADPDSLEGVLEAYDSPSSRVSDLELVLLAEWWGAFDPSEAFRQIHEWTGKERFAPAAEVFRVWARHNPADALKAADKVPGEHKRRASLDAALIGWDESLESGVGEFIYELPDGNDRQLAMRLLARRRVTTLGAEAALDWARNLPETRRFRELMVPRVASAIAESQPETAARWAESRIDGDSVTQLPRRIATRWISRDPEAAMAWLESLPAGEDRRDGIMETFRDWLRQDRPAAGAWLDSRVSEGPVPGLDPALFIYARAVGGKEPERGLYLASLITKETDRNAAHTIILRGWLVGEPESAEAWIAEADLPDGVVKRARMLPSKHPGRDAGS
jgi:hypothetical protein